MNNITTQEYINVSSNLVTSRGWFQVILSYYKNGKRYQKWKSLKLKDVTGNRKIAKKKQKEVEREFEKELNTAKGNTTNDKSSILYGDYLKDIWLKNIKHSVEITTYSGYETKVNIIADYFNEQGITISNLKMPDIKKFYNHLMETRGIKYITVKRYHACIHKSLEDAIQLGLIEFNVSSNIKHEKTKQYIAKYYNLSELEKLFEVAHDTKSIIELHILISSYYGLRREEVVGLRWSAIDFNLHTITISHTVTHCTVDKTYTMVEKDRTKNKSSYRTLPLIPKIEEVLLKEKERQEANKKIFGNGYKNDSNYILVDDEGKLIRPDRVTRTFKKLLEDNNLRVITFHGLRHSTATLMLSLGKTKEEIQIWLGHSSVQTTEMYANDEVIDKKSSANAIAQAFSHEGDTRKSA